MSDCNIVYVAVNTFVSPAASVSVSATISSPSYKSNAVSPIRSETFIFNSSLPVFFSSILKYAVSPTFSVTFSAYVPSSPVALTVLAISKFAVFVSSDGVVPPTVAVFSIAPSIFSISTVNVKVTVSPAGTNTSLPFTIVCSSIVSPAKTMSDTSLVFAGIVSCTNAVASASPVFNTVIVYLI